jgi:mannose-6-phosphate isomerase-like protein (cupin superfamily)
VRAESDELDANLSARVHDAAMTEAHSQVVLVDNPHVKVTQEHVPVGGEIERHTHDLPHVIVPISGDRVQQLDADGNVLFEVDYNTLPPGICLFIGPEVLPLTHSLRNVGDAPVLNLRIDLPAQREQG